jgi:molecular chaperone DnaK (HSP70)
VLGLAVVASLLGCSGPDVPGRVVVEADSPATRGDRLVESVSIETGHGELAPILEAGCPLPCSETVTFGTAEPGQTTILLHLYRGNGSTTDRAVPLGTFEIAGFPLVSGAEIEVRLVFRADADGVSLRPEPGEHDGIAVRRVGDETARGAGG